MAQPRPRSTHVDTWIVTTISLPAALAGALRVPLRNRTIPEPWGLPSPPGISPCGCRSRRPWPRSPLY